MPKIPRTIIALLLNVYPINMPARHKAIKNTKENIFFPGVLFFINLTLIELLLLILFKEY